MIRALGVTAVVFALAACAGPGGDRIGSLNRKRVEVDEPVIEGALEKAMAAYRRFLEETEEESAATPEAMRRLADLQLAAATGSYDYVEEAARRPARVEAGEAADAPRAAVTTVRESEREFEARATRIADLSPAAAPELPPDAEAAAALDKARAEEAIVLYTRLLERYPLYPRNDQVLYQLARAYEESGRPEEAMAVLDRLVREYPQSVHYDEAQFRRGEIFFVRKAYRDAERAYAEVVRVGERSAFFDQALFKRGWSIFKQSDYERALDDFFRLLDIKTAAGHHIPNEHNKTEHQRVLDTFRVVSLSFSYLGGPEAVARYLARRGVPPYENLVYMHLAEHYFEKRRYQDAADVYKAFLARRPLHEAAPVYHMRIIEIYREGRFPRLVLEAKREFAERYDPAAEYWKHHDLGRRPDVLAFVKSNLVDLAKHYHALSQQARKRDERQAAYREAVGWYRRFLKHFADDPQAPELNFLLADLLYENRAFGEAALEYERTAYGYPPHPRAAEAGYAAVLAYREHEKNAPPAEQRRVHLQAIRSALQFADTFPAHPQAPAVLTHAAENLYALGEHERALAAARTVVERHGDKADAALLTAAWTVIGHAQFDLARYAEAENAYAQVLARLPANDPRRAALVEKQAAAVYKQAEAHQIAGEREQAVADYLRVARIAPGSAIHETAQLDAAALLIQLENWPRAREVLEAFRRLFPNSQHQGDVTTKLAYVYERSGDTLAAAREYTRIADLGDDPALRREALHKAAELYEQGGKLEQAAALFERLLRELPGDFEQALEARAKLADLYGALGRADARRAELERIVAEEAAAGRRQTPRSRHLAASAALALAEPLVTAFAAQKLGAPFEKTLARKKQLMQRAMDAFTRIVDYGVAETTAAATYHIAELYHRFSRDLLDSERPDDLNELELEQYELLLEEQAYPFEEKAIAIHQKNLELLTRGVYNPWILKSLDRLAELVPARYAKREKQEPYFASIY
ncbi:MAG: hypothetical protein KatS3mg121_0278 [Gammaproteobacteria bacterium]|nr:MAG: hypothetical protein KatS3mg121_0278 [Gammaproteobacteria bacterium]